ncbi:MAG TPA: proline dehydrogenase family protein [Ktedonobacteraceae bacterium]|nr:proline dehydrogenase family protein [Ktedonobacteraceae bacterium]
MSTSDLEAKVAAALRHISRNENIKAYVQRNTQLHAIFLRSAMRLIGGETLASCLEIAQTIQKQDHAITIDYIGENTRSAAVAQQVTEEFLRVIRAIIAHNLRGSVSLDLSHIGLVIDTDLALNNASMLAQAAHEAGIEVIIGMEGSERTTDILAVYRKLSGRFANVGITLQAYLYRTPADLASALEYPGRIRLVKGAYEEADNIALPRGVRLDATYRNLMEILLASGHSCSLATHDQVLLDHAHTFIQGRNLSREHIEFSMLYGVTPERLQTMRERGYSTSIYLPYGQEWYLYLCHRLAEYPPAIYQAIVDAVGIEK